MRFALALSGLFASAALAMVLLAPTALARDPPPPPDVAPSARGRRLRTASLTACDPNPVDLERCPFGKRGPAPETRRDLARQCAADGPGSEACDDVVAVQRFCPAGGRPRRKEGPVGLSSGGQVPSPRSTPCALPSHSAVTLEDGVLSSDQDVSLAVFDPVCDRENCHDPVWMAANPKGTTLQQHRRKLREQGLSDLISLAVVGPSPDNGATIASLERQREWGRAVASARWVAAGRPRLPNIVLVVVDTMARSAMHTYAPDFEAFLSTSTATHEAVWFEQYSTMEFTTTLFHVSALLSGRKYTGRGEHRLLDNRVPPDEWLPRLLGQRGYRTVLGDRHIASKGAQVPSVVHMFDELMPDLRRVAPAYNKATCVGDATNTQLQMKFIADAVAERGSGNGPPVFGYFHTFEAHHAESDAKWLGAHFIPAIADIMERAPNTAVMVLADHGQKLKHNHFTPFAGLLMPKTVLERHPTWLNNLRTNAKDSVFTVLDVYQTLAHIGGLPNVQQSECSTIYQRKNGLATGVRPQKPLVRRSLVREYPENRWPGEAGIVMREMVLFTEPLETVEVDVTKPSEILTQFQEWVDLHVKSFNAWAHDRFPDECPKLHSPTLRSAKYTTHSKYSESMIKFEAHITMQPDPDFEFMALHGMHKAKFQRGMTIVESGKRPMNVLIPVNLYERMELCAPEPVKRNGMAFKCFCHLNM